MPDSQTENQADDAGVASEDAATDERGSPGFFAVTMSVIAAAFGVQTEKNRERDFEHGSPVVYIVAGLIFTVLFVLTIAGVVSLVLPE